MSARIEKLLGVSDEELQYIYIVRALPDTTIKTMYKAKSVKPITKYGALMVFHEDVVGKQYHRVFSIEPIAVRYYLVDDEPFYMVSEPPVRDLTKKLYVYIRQRVAEASINKEDYIKYVVEEVLMGMLNLSLDEIRSDPDIAAAVYYAYRDTYGYGPIHIMMLDKDVEEISWFDHRYTIKVVSRRIQEDYPSAEFIATNIGIDPHEVPERRDRIFIMEQVVRQIAARAGVGLTVARPLRDGKIPDPRGFGFHRLAAHLSIISASPAFTIRKFPEVKYSIANLVSLNTLSPLAAAYLFFLLLHRAFILIVGGMGSGKTTLLQALLSALPSTYKLITIEDTPEIQTPADNLHPLYTRYAPLGGEIENITPSVLVKHSLRHRGTIVTLGEVRGEEYNDLLQAAASGHGAACTFHADDPFSVLMRITAPPINAAPESLLQVAAVVHIAKTYTYVTGKPKMVRRVIRIFEIADIRKIRRREVGGDVRVFTWDPLTDTHIPEYSVSMSTGERVRVLKELWRRSKSLRVLGYNLYGVEAPHILVDVMLYADLFETLAARGIHDIFTVLRAVTRYSLRHPEKSQRIWQRLRPAFRQEMREIEEKGYEALLTVTPGGSAAARI